MEGVDTIQIVRDALAWDGRINEANLSVHVGQGVVTLGGVVASERERQEAADVAQHVTGVTVVLNEIIVVERIGRDVDRTVG